MPVMESVTSQFEKFYAGLTVLKTHIPGANISLKGSTFVIGPINDFMPNQLILHLKGWGWNVNDKDFHFEFTPRD